ncbi:cell division protein FtsQ/DivIB [Halobacillus mangrovi]|uniref:cell division protein FtsQ/DivIB n=1 Tax=Halobacillus mangrovi TaxID=402384 RepID=UPI003D96036E
MEERKIVSIEDRIPKLKQTRKKKANRRLIVYLTILFLLIATVVYLQSPLSDVREVVVKGQQHVSEEEIQEISKITKDTNIWQVESDKIKKRLESHNEITFADVNRKFPSTVQIEVEEAERIGYVKENGEFRPILENGTELKSTSPLPGGDAPILAGFNKPTYLKEMSQELKELPDSVSSLISEIHWEPKEDNPYQIRLYMTDGYQVLASIRTFSSKMPAYPSIVSQLDEGLEGIIHIDVGAYFEEFTEAEQEQQSESTEQSGEESVQQEISQQHSSQQEAAQQENNQNVEQDNTDSPDEGSIQEESADENQG